MQPTLDISKYSPVTAQTAYHACMVNIRAAIEAEHGSLSAFCRRTGLSTPRVLRRIFNNSEPRSMSLGLFASICGALDSGNGTSHADRTRAVLYHRERANMSLLEYFQVVEQVGGIGWWAIKWGL